MLLIPFTDHVISLARWPKAMRYLLPITALLILPVLTGAQGIRVGIRVGVNAAFTGQNSIIAW